MVALVCTPRTVARTTLRVLIVEDYPEAAAILEIMLRNVGHEVGIARDGPAALTKAQADQPDVVLLDIGLPVMDGFEVAKHLKRAGGRPPFIIALTGYGQEEDYRRSSQSGIDLHLLKPVEPAALLHVLKRFQAVVA
jgi:CheY-like chemotaxis protein